MTMLNIDEILEHFAQIEWERIKREPFPYPNIDAEMCSKEWETLCSKQLSIKTPSLIIKRFHESIYEAHKENKPSNKEFWKKIQKDFNTFQAFYKNRLIHSNWVKVKDNEKYLKIGFLPNFVYLQGISTSGKAPAPSYFKPMLAKYLITKYLNKFSSIFDPFSGFSGRLLGALACHKNYKGFDLSEIHINESRYIVDYLRKYYDIPEKTYLKAIDSTRVKGKYECLFTCTPYSSLEKWNEKDKEYSCDRWVSICLKNYKCKRYVFVTDDKIKKYKKYIKEKLINKSHWGTNYEYVIVIDR